jgi:hypothetical protein
MRIVLIRGFKTFVETRTAADVTQWLATHDLHAPLTIVDPEVAGDDQTKHTGIWIMQSSE